MWGYLINLYVDPFLSLHLTSSSFIFIFGFDKKGLNVPPFDPYYAYKVVCLFSVVSARRIRKSLALIQRTTKGMFSKEEKTSHVV